LGGRAAEELMFGKISTGALSDLEKVTKQAYAMVSIYGLNKRLGNVSYYDSQGRDMFTKPYSDDTAKIIDEEVSELIESQYQRALEILNNHKEKLIQLADKLLTEEVIFKENLEEIFGKRPWDPKEEADTTDAISSIETPQEPTTEQNENPEPDTDPT
jgi:cell division protease FtsH